MNDKLYIRIYSVLFAAAALLVAAVFCLNSGEQIHRGDDSRPGVEIEPQQVRELDGENCEFTISTADMNDGSYDLIFYTRHQFVDVRLDGRLAYSLQIESARFGNTPGNYWNFIEIPYGTQEALVHVRAAYPMVNNTDITFIQAKPLVYHDYLVKRCLPEVFLSVISIIIGLVMMVYWIIVRRRAQANASLVYIGLFSCIIGLWTLLMSDIAALELRNQQASSFMRYVLLIFLGIPFLYFIKEFIRVKYRKTWHMLCIANLVWIPAVIAMQLLRITDLRQTSTVTHVLVVAVLVFMIVNLIAQIRVAEKKAARNLRISLYGVIILLIAVCIALYGYYHGMRMVGLAGHIGFTLYTVLIGLTAIFDLVSIIEAGKKAEIYRTLAVKDVLTGMYNRNAYIEKISKIVDPEDMMIVTFDLNNLKQCNDNQGHMYGDKYIIAASGMIEQVFASHGDCYRIGGDEFCVILPRAASCDIKQLLHTLAEKQESYNSSSTDIFMQIACGYAVFDAAQDRDIEAVRSRADVMMYAHKKELKAQKKTERR